LAYKNTLHFPTGIPLVVVGICVIVDPDVYKEGREDLCIMSAHANLPMYYIAYIGPIAIMIFINVAIFVRIFRVLYKQSNRVTKPKKTKNSDKPGKESKPEQIFTKNPNMRANGKKETKTSVKISPTQIKGAVTVMILVGFGWIFGLFAIGPFQTFFRYVFTICNGGQGVLIFIFRVALHPQVSKYILSQKKLNTRPLRSTKKLLK